MEGGRAMKIILVATIFLATLPFTSLPVPAQERIRVGLTSLAPTTLPVWVAKRQGYFQQEGLLVEPIVFTSGTINSQAALAGEIDIALGSGTEVFTIRLAGEDARFFFGISNFMPFKLFVNPSIKTPADLKGKRLAVSRFGAQSDFLTRYAISKLGLNPATDVTILQIGSTPARYAALKAGAVDATIMWFPQTLVADREGFRRLADLAEIFPDWSYMGYYAKGEHLRAQRDRVLRFLRAHNRGLQEVQRNPETGIGILQKHLKYDRAVAEAGYREFSKALAADGRLPSQGIEFLIDEERKAGNLKERLSLADLTDTTFIEHFAQGGK